MAKSAPIRHLGIILLTGGVQSPCLEDGACVCLLIARADGCSFYRNLRVQPLEIQYRHVSCQLRHQIRCGIDVQVCFSTGSGKSASNREAFISSSHTFTDQVHFISLMFIVKYIAAPRTRGSQA